MGRHLYWFSVFLFIIALASAENHSVSFSSLSLLI
jgi:hypothetical protein